MKFGCTYKRLLIALFSMLAVTAATQALASPLDNWLITPQATNHIPIASEPASGWRAKWAERAAEREQEIAQMPEEELRQHPFLYWRKLASKRPPVVRVCVILFLAALMLAQTFASRVEMARACCKRYFWRCLGRGALVLLLMLLFVRPLIVSEVGIPLAMSLVAVIEFLLVCGFTISSVMIGKQILSKLRLENRLSNRPFWLLFLQLLCGTIVLGMILSIPGIGHLPPIGIRIVLWISLMGAGGLFKTRLGVQMPD